MYKDKILIVAEGFMAHDAALAKLVDEGKVKIISMHQAKERGLAPMGRPPIQYPAPVVLDYPNMFNPHPTRAQRRKEKRKK